MNEPDEAAATLHKGADGRSTVTAGDEAKYFPKRSDLRVHTPADLAAIENRLNNRPRKTLGWLTPAQVFAAALPS